MEKKGQWYLLIGVLLSIGAIILTYKFVPEWEFIGFFRGLFAGMGIVFTVNGFVLIIRAKRKKK